MLRLWRKIDSDEAYIDRLRRIHRRRYLWAGVMVFLGLILIGVASWFAWDINARTQEMMDNADPVEEQSPRERGATQKQFWYFIGFVMGGACWGMFASGFLVLLAAVSLAFDRTRSMLIKYTDMLNELSARPPNADDRDFFGHG